MLKEALRFSAGTVAVPVGAGVRTVNRWSSGPRAILDVQVPRSEDVAARHAVVHRLRRVAVDRSVAGVVLRLSATPGSWASCQDLRATIAGLRDAGKVVYAWVEAPGNAAMWIASACDRVFLVPTGEVGLVGLGADLVFFGSAFGKLGLEADFEAAGAYKSFGEPYTRSFASAENQEAVQELVDDLHGQLVDGIAQARELEVAQVEALLARAPLSAEEALEAGLVDQIAYSDEMEQWIAEEHGERSKLVPFASWSRRDAVADWVERWGEGGAVVSVLHLEGPIVMDEKRPDVVIRARKVVPILKKLRENDEVAAVVLHVNSPGGSALASDLIWREVELLSRAKPVVASFEGVAASGGYYLAAPAAEILVRPGTLTGSIGVFGGKLVTREGLRKVGVHTQSFTSAPNANLFSSTRPFSDEQRVRFREMLERFYSGFVQRVASGRRTPAEAIERHCRGRVWTGRAALERGLADASGDVYTAIERARALASLRVGAYRRQDLSPSQARSMLGRVLARLLQSLVPRGARQAAALRLADLVLDQVLSPALQVVLTHPDEPLALMPFDLHIR